MRPGLPFCDAASDMTTTHRRKMGLASQYATDHNQPIEHWQQLRDAFVAGYRVRPVDSHGCLDHPGVADVSDIEQVEFREAALTDAECLAIFSGLMTPLLCPIVELLKEYEREIQKTINDKGGNPKATDLEEVARMCEVVGRAKVHILAVSVKCESAREKSANTVAPLWNPWSDAVD